VIAQPIRRKISAVSIITVLAQGACLSSVRRGTGCEDCGARVTSSLPKRVGLPRDSVRARCPDTVSDLDDNTRLTLMRALPHARADYNLPVGRYGPRADELLRIHCGDGTVAGLVPR
jgi:hypothetical protein